MKPYPSIPDSLRVDPGTPCIAFHKYDGSNLRFEWSKKRGWRKFGTRTRLFDATDPVYAPAIPLFMDRFADRLALLFKNTFRCDEAIAFCEWFGPNSFAGQHRASDPKELVLLDVNVHKRGMIAPATFVDVFPSVVPTAEVVYRGPLTPEYILSVRENGAGEGVVCKGGEGHKVWMCKIKTNAYLKRLKEHFGQDWNKFWE